MACRRRAGRSGDGRRFAPLGAAAARLEARDLRQQALRLGLRRLRRGGRRRARQDGASMRARRSSCRTASPTRRRGRSGLPCGGEIDVFVEPFTGAPPVERGTSYVVVAGEGLGERWQGDADGKTGLARGGRAHRVRRACLAAAAARDRRRGRHRRGDLRAGASARLAHAGRRAAHRGSRRASGCRAPTS